MAKKQSSSDQSISREKLAALLNEDLSREYQAIIAYVVYSQVLKGAQYMNIADQLDTCAARIRTCTDHFPPDRLSWKNANGNSEARPDIGRCQADASVRS